MIFISLINLNFSLLYLLLLLSALIHVEFSFKFGVAYKGFYNVISDLQFGTISVIVFILNILGYSIAGYIISSLTTILIVFNFNYKTKLPLKPKVILIFSLYFCLLISFYGIYNFFSN